MSSLHLEIIAVRDPDGGTDIQAFVDGVPVTHDLYSIDAGAGWAWSDWCESRDYDLAQASPGARPFVEQAYAGPPGSVYIDGAPEGDTDDPAYWLQPYTEGRS